MASILTKEAKLEIIGLIGEAINEAGGLSVQGTMIGEGGVQVVVNPTIPATKIDSEYIKHLVGNYLQTINNQDTSEALQKQISYIPDIERPNYAGAWKVKAKHTFDFEFESADYAYLSDEWFIIDNIGNKIHIYDGTSFNKKSSIDTLNTYSHIKVSSNGTRLFLQKDSKEMHIFTKVDGKYIKSQTFTASARLSFNIDPQGSVLAILKSDSYNGSTNYYTNYLYVYELSDIGGFIYKTRSSKIDSFYVSYINRDLSYLPIVANDGSYVIGFYREYNYTSSNYTYLKKKDNGDWYQEEFYDINEVSDLEDRLAFKPLFDNYGYTYRGGGYVSPSGEYLLLRRDYSIDVYRRDDDVAYKDNPMKLSDAYIWNFNDTFETTKSSSIFEVKNGVLPTLVDRPVELIAPTNAKVATFSKGSIIAFKTASAMEKQTFSYAFKIKVDNTHSEYNYILVNNACIDTNVKGRGILLATKDGRLVLRHGAGDNTFEDVTSDAIIEDGNWHDVIVNVTNGGIITFIIDGIKEPQKLTAKATISYENSLSHFQLGGLHENSNDPASFGEFELTNLTYLPDANITDEQVKIFKTLIDVTNNFDKLYSIATMIEPDSNGIWLRDFKPNMDFSEIYISNSNAKTVYRYELDLNVVTNYDFATADDWTLDANSTIDNNKLALDHTAGDNEVKTTIDSLLTTKYSVKLSYETTDGDANDKVIVTLGDATKEFVLNEFTNKAEIFEVTDLSSHDLVIKTDNTCNARAYNITAVEVTRIV